MTFFDIGSTKAKQFGFTMQLKSGKKFTCVGDEPYNEVDYKYVKGSDWLLHEAFCLFGEADKFKPYEKHHSTALDAGRRKDSSIIMAICMCRMIWRRLRYRKAKENKNRLECKKICRRAGFLAFIFDPEGTIKKSKTLSPWLKKIEHIIVI